MKAPLQIRLDSLPVAVSYSALCTLLFILQAFQSGIFLVAKLLVSSKKGKEWFASPESGIVVRKSSCFKFLAWRSIASEGVGGADSREGLCHDLRMSCILVRTFFQSLICRK